MLKLDVNLQNEICNISKESIHIKTMEETAELISSLTSKKLNITDIAEEICDVYICLYRLRKINPIKFRLKIKHLAHYDNKNIINILSSFQQSVSKNYLYTHYNKDKFFRRMTNVYGVLYYLMDKYNIYDDVQSWIVNKEFRDKNLLDNGTKWYPKR